MNASNVLSNVTALIVRPAADLAVQLVVSQSNENMQTNSPSELWARYCNASANELMTNTQAAFCDEIELSIGTINVATNTAATLGLCLISARLIRALRDYLFRED